MHEKFVEKKKSIRQKFKLRNNKSWAGTSTDNTYTVGETGHTQEQIFNDIKEMTGLSIKTNNGAEIYLEGEEDWIAAKKVLALELHPPANT